MKNRSPALILAVLAFLPAVPGAETPAADQEVPVFHATLENGLRVALVPQDAVPSVAMKLSFRVTGRDEPADRNGIGAVAFMTLVGEGRTGWVSRVERKGGWWDPTNFYPEIRAQDVVLPARDLDTGLAVFREMLEAAAAPTRDLAAFRQERKAALGCIPPAPRASVLLREGFAEPFAGNDPLGSRAVVERLSDDEVLAFRRRHFVPARAMVTLVGDFEPAEALDKVRKVLGAVPNPDDAVREAQVLRLFRPGSVVIEEPAPAEGPRMTVRAAWAVPPEVPGSALGIMARLFLEHLQEDAALAGRMVQPDMAPGQRLLRTAFPGEPRGILAALEARIASFPDAITEERTRASAADFIQSSSGRFGSAYWQSWPVAFPFEGLGWGWNGPWKELARVHALTAADLRAAARGIFVTERRLLVGSAGTAEEKEGLRKFLGIPEGKGERAVLATLPEKAGFPENPPPVAGARSRTTGTIANEMIRSLAGGRLLFLEDPARPWFHCRGFYPLGTLERDTRAYAASLAAACRPAEGQEPWVRFAARPDRLVFELDIGGEEGLRERLDRIRAWLKTPPAADPGTAPIPALACVADPAPGEAPAWTLAVSGPGLPAWLAAYRPDGPERTSPLPVPVRRLEEPVGKEKPAHLLVPLAGMEDPVRRAAALFLMEWLDPAGRQDRRYGPFTLKLPPLPHEFPSVDGARLGRDAWIALGAPKGKPHQALAWLKSGAGLADFLASSPDALEQLRGRALWTLRERFMHAAPSALFVPVLAAHEGDGKPDWFDHVEGAVRTLDAKRLGEIAGRLLSGALAPGAAADAE